MENYVTFSIETHLFFARIMKEHALFLEVGFQGKDVSWIQKAQAFRLQFEELLRQTVRISDALVQDKVLRSEELVTRFTIPAEKRTSSLTGVPIDSEISEMEQKLRAECGIRQVRMVMRMVNQINRRAMWLLNGLIRFKEDILREVKTCRLFTANYPLLIEHITREAKLYRATLIELGQNKKISYRNLRAKEDFWNQIMMEHAWFIRGLLDPSEVELIESADEFAAQYGELLETAKEQDCKATEELTKQSLEQTLKYREFKTAGAEGILDCKISSLILPLLADHVLREANHYIRILESSDVG